jgi:hypothetical protein
MNKAIVALYDNLDEAQRVVQDLIDAGLSRDNISIVANDVSGDYGRHVADVPAEGEHHVGPAEGSAFGSVVGGLTGLLVGLGALAIPGIGPVIAAGPLVAGLAGALTGAVAGGATGGIVGGLLSMGVPEDDAQYYAEGIRRGGTLVSATVDDVFAPRVQAIMNSHNPVDVQQRAETWQQTGWQGFNASGTAYDAETLRRERETYLSGGAARQVSSDSSPTTHRARMYERSTRVE